MGILQQMLQQKWAAAEQARLAEARKGEMGNLLKGLPMTAAGAVGPLLTSTDPQAFELGVRQLEEYQRRQSPEVQQGMAATAQQMTGERLRQQQSGLSALLNLQQARRLEQMFPGQKTLQDLAIRSGQLGVDQLRLQNDALRNPQAAPITPQVMSQITDQAFAAQSLNENIRATDTLADIWEQFGTLASKDAKVAGEAQYAALAAIPALQSMFNSGTLNEGEKDFFQGLLSNPSSLVDRLLTRDQKAITMLRAISARERRKKALFKELPIGVYLPESVWAEPERKFQGPAGTVPVEMPILPQGGTQTQMMLEPYKWLGARAVEGLRDYAGRMPGR
jgi:hypothetical protein